MTRDDHSAHPPSVLEQCQPLIRSQLEVLSPLIQPNGAVLASPHTHYEAHWVRDSLYVLAAAEYLGMGDLVRQLIRVPFTIFHKHRAKIQAGIRRKPGENYDFIHARYHPTHFDELAAEWGHNQLDMLGLFLFLAATLPARGVRVFRHAMEFEDKLLLNQITRYLETMQWWSCPDFGVWEEGPKLNSSSIGAVLAGLQSVQRLEDPDLYFNEAQLEKGREALNALLPAESGERPCDLAQLSLIWPFDILDDEQVRAVLDNIEGQLVRERGVIRYAGDAYFNAADKRLSTTHDRRTGLDLADYAREEDRREFPCREQGSEAQWPLGFAWLSIVHSKLAKRCSSNDEDHAEHAEKAGNYLMQLIDCAIPVPGMGVGYIPELYVGNEPNVNTPLAWTTAFAIVAAVAYSEIEDRDVPYHPL